MDHGAVAAEPSNERLREVLSRHKAEVARGAAEATGLAGREAELLVIMEGLTQVWTLHRDAAVESAKRLGTSLRNQDA